MSRASVPCSQATGTPVGCERTVLTSDAASIRQRADGCWHLGSRPARPCYLRTCTAKSAMTTQLRGSSHHASNSSRDTPLCRVARRRGGDGWHGRWGWGFRSQARRAGRPAHAGAAGLLLPCHQVLRRNRWLQPHRCSASLTPHPPGAHLQHGGCGHDDAGAHVVKLRRRLEVRDVLELEGVGHVEGGLDVVVHHLNVRLEHADGAARQTAGLRWSGGRGGASKRGTVGGDGNTTLRNPTSTAPPA